MALALNNLKREDMPLNKEPKQNLLKKKKMYCKLFLYESVAKYLL